MTGGAAALLRLVAHLRDGAPLPADDREHVTAGIDEWLAGNAATLDAALHVQPQPGQRRVPTVYARTRRDALVRDAAQRFAEGRTDAAKARWVAERWRRYASGAWPRERALSAPPAHRAGTVEALLFEAMRIADATLGERTIRGILASSGVYSLPDYSVSLVADKTE